MKTVYFDKDIPRILATKFAAKHAKGLQEHLHFST